MKYFIVTTLILLTSLEYNLKAQQISSEGYNKEYIHEDFNKENELFKTVTNTDNYFILDRGDYLLSRNNNKTEYAIMVNNSSISDFVLKTAIKIGPSENKQASVGVILKAQEDGKGALIFEVNVQAEYRIKQLIGSTYHTLSGEANKGWVRSKLINKVDKQNLIEIRSEKNIYDIYTNGEYLTTFFVPDFTSGSCGLIISPETKARVSYYYVNTKGDETLIANYNNQDAQNINTTTIEGLNKRVTLLEENNTIINEQKIEGKEVQKIEIEKLKSNNNKLETVTTQQEKEILDLKKKNNRLQIENKNIWGDYELEARNISKLQQINIKHQDDIAELNQKINIKKNEISNLNKKNTKLASVTLEQEKQLKTLQNSAESLRVAENKASEKNTKLNQKISKLNKIIDDSKQQISLEKKKNSELENNLKKQISLEKKKNSELENNLDKLTKSSEKKNNQLNTRIKETEEKSSDLTKRNNTLNKDLAKARSANKKTKNTLEEANDELTGLRNTQAQHDNVIANLNTQITDLNNRNDQLTSHLEIANNKNTALEATNHELKELFIIKDFELNGIKPSEVAKENSNIPADPKVLIGNKTIYSVQFGVYMQEQPYSSMRNIDNVWYNTTEQGTYVYYSGEFNLPQEAAAHMKDLLSKGYKNALVVTLTK